MLESISRFNANAASDLWAELARLFPDNDVALVFTQDPLKETQFLGHVWIDGIDTGTIYDISDEAVEFIRDNPCFVRMNLKSNLERFGD
jgi:hypothetical protein